MSTETPQLNHRQKQAEIEKNLERKLQQVKDDEAKKAQMIEAVRELPHVPGTCPVARCNEVIFPCNLMVHMLHKHVRKPNTMTSEIYDHMPVVVCFDPSSFLHNENHCVATFMYGGVKRDVKTRPGLSNLSRPNTALISQNCKYENYLPIMMMVCRSTWYAQLKDKQLERQLVDMNGSKAIIYVVWLVAPCTTRKLHYTLTVYDRHCLNARSVVRVVRNYTSFQNPSDFLPYEDNYLLMRESEMRDFITPISALGRGPWGGKIQQKLGMPMEVIVYEHPPESPVRHSSAKQIMEAQAKLKEIYLEESSARLSGGGKKSKGKSKSLKGNKLSSEKNASNIPTPTANKSTQSIPIVPIGLEAEEKALELLEDQALKTLEEKRQLRETSWGFNSKYNDNPLSSSTSTSRVLSLK